MTQADRPKPGPRRSQRTAVDREPSNARPVRHEPALPGTRPFPYGLAVFILALAVRLVYLYESSANPTFATPIMDSADYDDLARTLVEGGRPHTPLFWQPIFYPLFLAAVYRVTSSSILAAKAIQIILGSVTCLLSYRLGRRLFDRPTGLLAGVITALYGPLIFFDAELLATGWAAFWSVALILLFLGAASSTKPGPSLALGAAAALSVITRPTFLPVIAAGCIWLTFVWHRTAAMRTRALPGLVMVGVGFLLVAGPVAMLNHRLWGRVGILPATGGINFYIGNNPDAAETISHRPGRDWNQLLALPRQHGVQGNMWDDQRFFYRQARDWISSRPTAFLRGLGRKGVQFVSAREIPRSLDLYVFRTWSTVLSALTWKVGGFGFPFGLLLPLAVVGLIHHRRTIPGPMWLLLILYPLSIIVVFVAARYRAPLIGVLSIPAAAGCLALINAIREQHWRRLASRAALIAGVIAVISLPGPFRQEQPDYAAELHLLLGNRLFDQQKVTDAVKEFRKGLEFAPDDPDLHGRLAEALLTAGQIDGAITHYTESVRLRPGSAVNRACLGIALQEKGQLDRAIEEYRKALDLDPQYGKVYSNLGAALQRAGQLDQAIDAYRHAARLEPDEAIIHYNLGAALAQRGDLETAVRELSRSLDIDPANVDARYELAVALYRQDRRDEAAAELQEILRIDPHHDAARARLADLQHDRTSPP
jgi:tetratricopeptide (TPR) repeat protein